MSALGEQAVRALKGIRPPKGYRDWMRTCKFNKQGHCTLFGTHCSGIVCPHRAPQENPQEKPEPEKGGDAS